MTLDRPSLIARRAPYPTAAAQQPLFPWSASPSSVSPSEPLRRSQDQQQQQQQRAIDDKSTNYQSTSTSVVSPIGHTNGNDNGHAATTTTTTTNGNTDLLPKQRAPKYKESWRGKNGRCCARRAWRLTTRVYCGSFIHSLTYDITRYTMYLMV
jgi:hypothetical protein